MLPPPTMRSLDRFVTARGAALAGVTNDARRVRVMGIMASVHSLIGAVEAGVGAALMINGNPVPVLLLQGGLFIMTGGILAGAWKAQKRRLQQEPSLPVEVTPDAKALLQMLLTHLYGWPHSRLRRRRRFRRLMQQESIPLPEDAQCEEVLHPETFALLENAAQEANRIYGMLEQVEGRTASPVKQMAPAIAAAADEAMAAIFHLAAQLNKFPESSASVQGQVQSQIAELQALAEQMEQLCAVSEIPSSTRLQTVLQSLRSDLKARKELNASETSPAASYTAPPQTEEVQMVINRT